MRSLCSVHFSDFLGVSHSTDANSPALEWERKGTNAPPQSLLMTGSNRAAIARGRPYQGWLRGPWCTQGMLWGPTALFSIAQVQCPASACAQLLIYWIVVIYSAQQNHKLCFYVVLQIKPLKELSSHFKLFLWQMCYRLHPLQILLYSC